MKILGLLQNWSKKENNKLALQNQKNTALNVHLLFPAHTASVHGAAALTLGGLAFDCHRHSLSFSGNWSVSTFLRKRKFP